MTIHNLGGSWTEQKLNCVKGYAEAWVKVMESIKARGFIDSYIYIDAFSGTGKYQHNAQPNVENDDFFDTPEEKETLRKGSAQIALEISPKFDKIHLIELKPEFARELKNNLEKSEEHRVDIHQADANEALIEICGGLGPRQRALIFIDPYGCEVDWQTLERIAESKVADVWYLAPSGGINRQLSKKPSEIENYKRARLNRALGTEDWLSHFYEEETYPDLFGNRNHSRSAGASAVEQFYIERLRTIFSYVHPECLQLKNSKNGHMFSLCFAVSNDSKPAQDAAKRIAGHVIKKWSNR
ncbi:23S rRNA (adenine(2030)-N(6))-methyltransferase RlmJ [Amylibacter sp. IMCC11727]|uniref:three-Cys-motif partner protein TcmP n=1 Tax=Amylibacter sp. IMCC11727 TaxID=3039851 RepID=UPI00244E543A|nr:23S rRNA (adenine(2030)-N(6))-methyltransferase RlmJ [Amylibacter sp. IMCC11727]WGI22428.1 23S rRNA (adenine(2030)-N(6))-methyltransferase RlmJ [Amylibacter sp. IMCC11727]